MTKFRFYSFVVILFSTSLLASSQQARVQTKTLSVSAGGTLRLSTEGGDVNISTWDRPQVVVEAKGIEDSSELSIKQSGNRVEVNFHPRWNWHHQITFNLQIPKQFNLEIETSGGDIDLKDNLDGTAQFRSSGGDIESRDVSGRAVFKTSGGDISSGRLGPDSEIRTAGGDISLASTDGSLDAETAGGDIHIGDVGGQLSVSTAGGDIRVGDVTGAVNASTAGGDIDLGQVSASVSARTAGGDIKLKSARGTVEAKTSGGDIDSGPITGSLVARTSGGDIDVSLIPDPSGPSRMSSRGGSLSLALPANARVSIHAVIKIRGNWERNSQHYGIHSDFPTGQIEKDRNSDEIRAVFELNGGGHRIDLETQNGNIEIRKMAQ